MPVHRSDQEEDPKPEPPPVPKRIIPADTLFQGEREVCIEHSGVRYWLRITRRNRLILQK